MVHHMLYFGNEFVSFIDTYCFLVFSWLCNQVYTTILMHDVLVSVKQMLLSTGKMPYFLNM